MNSSQPKGDKKRIIIAITGASGAVYGVRLLEILRELDGIESHLVLSRSARLTLQQECDMGISDVSALADIVHQPNNIGAPIASGSFRVHGMIIAPCSVKTASSIACGVTDGLVSRAGDVMLKERRPLVVAIRETPLHRGHLETLVKLAGLGAIIFPPVPGFYQRPEQISDIVDQTCMRLLDQIDIHVESAPRWGEAGGVPAIGDQEANES